MSDTTGQQPSPDDASRAEAQPSNSVLRFLDTKTGRAPRVSLRDDDPASIASPLIDPSSKEKLAVPHGRGNYQLVGEIARGGMGVVLKGIDTDLGREIAIKVLDKRLSERLDVVQRFVEEAQIGGQLQHPGIVPVYELGLMEDERPYFTMKLVKGRTLAALLNQRETPASNRGSLIDTFESACQTIAYAHSRGVIHRDLKPANIMVGAFGEVQVVDWGLAKVLARGGTADEKRSSSPERARTILETVRSEGSGSGSQSLLGSVLGTPAYMPPEQARGRTPELDERSDVFALGAILSEILTGFPPYVGEPDEIIAAAAQAELQGAYERLDACGADPALINAAKQCLTADPAARPADAGVLAERIRKHVVSSEERAHRAEVEAAEARIQAAAEQRARRLTLALAASVLAIAVIGGGGWLWLQNERATLRQAEVARVRTVRAEVDDALTDATFHARAGHWNEALVATGRAHALAEGGGAEDEVLAEVEARQVELLAAQAKATRQEEFERNTERLLAELQQVIRPDEYAANFDPSEQDLAFRATFLDHGIDLDVGDLAAAAAQLTRRGLAADIAMALDAWCEVRRRSDDAPGAQRLLDLSQLVDPDPDRARLRQAVANRDIDRLRRFATEGLGNQPPSTHALLANSLLQLGERLLGLSVQRAALEMYPGDFRLHYLLGYELSRGFRQQRSPAETLEAQLHLRAALAIEPESAGARYYLATTHRRLQEREQELEQLDLALKLDPDNAAFLFRKGDALQELGRLDKAEPILERCAAYEHPSWVSAWSIHNLAEIAALRGERERALDLARQSLATNASTGSLIRIFMLSPHLLLVRHSGDPAAMREAEEQFVRDFGDSSPQAISAFAGILIRTASDLAVEWIELDRSASGNPILLTHARDWAQKGLALAPEDPSLWTHVGRASYLLADAPAAVDALTRANQLNDRDDPQIWLRLAMAHQAGGDEDQARAWLGRAQAWMAANPTDHDQRLQHLLAEAVGQIEPR